MTLTKDIITKETGNQIQFTAKTKLGTACAEIHNMTKYVLGSYYADMAIHCVARTDSGDVKFTTVNAMGDPDAKEITIEIEADDDTTAMAQAKEYCRDIVKAIADKTAEIASKTSSPSVQDFIDERLKEHVSVRVAETGYVISDYKKKVYANCTVKTPVDFVEIVTEGLTTDNTTGKKIHEAMATCSDAMTDLARTMAMAAA
ncbi:MAG: hypothetical protein HDQ88_02345 [Clostridia bacterium]|nr:hypothetical protein [Clostridia bacterium]